MWLQEIICVNYKSLKNVRLQLSRDTANVVIGINDCGKSTLMQAIGLLFSATKPKFNFVSEFQSRTDLSNSPVTPEEFNQVFEYIGAPIPTCDGNQSVILGKLIVEAADREDEKVAAYSTVLRWTLEKSGTDDLWLMSISDCIEKQTTNYLLTHDIIENGIPLQLLNQTQGNLQARVTAGNLQPIKPAGRPGGFTKEELIEAICEDQVLSPVWISYDKPSFRRDEPFYPEYQYLDWNISFSELETIANLAVKSSIEEQVSQAKEFAEARSDEAQEIVNKELSRFREALSEALPNIDAIKANVVFKVDSKLTDIFVNKSNTDGDIHLESQGEGIKRQIWFALLKWKAMQGGRGDNQHKDHIWCFDEPETHLYPKAQREFFEILSQIAAEEFQILISTHSTVFIDRAAFSEIRKFELVDSYTHISTCHDAPGVYEALQIRNSDFLFFDKFLVVEGDTEEVLIPHMFEIVKECSLVKQGIQLIKLGGKDKRREHCTIFESMLKDFNKTGESVVYLLDNDVRHELTPAEVEKFCEFTVGKQDLEDSIPVSIWAAIIQERFEGHPIAMSLEELQQVLDAISEDDRLQSSQKFYAVIKNSLKSKLGEDFYIVDALLPSKGRDLGNLLKEYIKVKDDVPASIVRAFDRVCL